jgi:hypothetical protein
MGKILKFGESIDYKGYSIRFEKSKVYKVLKDNIELHTNNCRTDAVSYINRLIKEKTAAPKCYRCGIKFYGECYDYHPIRQNGRDYCEDCIEKLK